MIKELLKKYSYDDVCASIIRYVYRNMECAPNASSDFMAELKKGKDEIVECFEENKVDQSIQSVLSMFEEVARERSRGVVYTPFKVSKLMFDKIEDYNVGVKFMDPSCGSGAILVNLVDYIHNKFMISPIDIINNSIYGMDNDYFSTKHCKFLLELLCLKLGYHADGLKMHIVNNNSMLVDWDTLGVRKFDYIFGNPPYIALRDMDKEEREQYEKHYEVAKGTYNMAHLFLEKAIKYVKPNGTISFLVINNLFTHISSKPVRELIMSTGYLHEVIEFNKIKLFENAEVLTTLITLKAAPHTKFGYARPKALNKIVLVQLPLSELKAEEWVFANAKQKEYLEHIRSFDTKLKTYMSGCIATLADKVFILDDEGKTRSNPKKQRAVKIEDGIVKEMYRPRNMEGEKAKKLKVLFPYDDDFKTLSLDDIRERFPKAYQYLKNNEEKLKQRSWQDQWYAFGRRQGLAVDHKAVLFGCYSRKPRFIVPEDDTALLLSGAYISSKIPVKPDVLAVILNSDVMAWYIKKVSFPIYGDYYYYGKKVVGDFSIPPLTDEEGKALLSMTKSEVNEFLIKKYDIEGIELEETA